MVNEDGDIVVAASIECSVLDEDADAFDVNDAFIATIFLEDALSSL